MSIHIWYVQYVPYMCGKYDTSMQYKNTSTTEMQYILPVKLTSTELLRFLSLQQAHSL